MSTMRRKRTFRPTGDCLESRDVPASFGVASRIVQFHQPNVASRLSTPFARTLRLSTGFGTHQLTFNRTATTGAGALNNNLGLNGLNGLTNNVGFNLGASTANTLTVNQLRSVLSQLAAGAPLGNGALLSNLLRANVNNPNLNGALGGNTVLRNVIRANINNPNLVGVLSSLNNTSLLNGGLNFPATLASQNFGFGTGMGLNGLMGSQFGNTGLLSTGTQGFVSFL